MVVCQGVNTSFNTFDASERLPVSRTRLISCCAARLWFGYTIILLFISRGYRLQCKNPRERICTRLLSSSLHESQPTFFMDGVNLYE